MARNIEIKARIISVADMLPLARSVATTKPSLIHQDDTFFHCRNGRLKLREFADGHGELIFYQRADQAGPKASFYLITPTSEPQSLRQVLSAAHGVLGRVVKERILLLAGRTRIHLDHVDALGDFLELEVVLGEQENELDGIAEARRLMETLGIASHQLVQGAYLDLLNPAAHPEDLSLPASAPR